MGRGGEGDKLARRWRRRRSYYDARLGGLHRLKGHGRGDILLTGEDAGFMAGEEDTRRDDWSSERGRCCDCDEEEESVLEGFHFHLVGCFPLALSLAEKAECETCSSQGKGTGCLLACESSSRVESSNEWGALLGNTLCGVDWPGRGVVTKDQRPKNKNKKTKNKTETKKAEATRQERGSVKKAEGNLRQLRHWTGH